jgi:hypothetical protein
MMQRVFVLGGYGVFGSQISDQLSKDKNAEIVIVGRDPKKGVPFANSLGAEFMQCDTQNLVALNSILTGAYLVINASGPFQALNYTIPELCIRQGCHYIDIGDGRKYVTEISRLHSSAEAKKIFVCVGASTAPAVTSAAIADLYRDFDQITSIKVALTAGNKNPAGVSTISTILTYIGLPVRVLQNGQWQDMPGWAGEFLEFPKPVGKRRVQLCDLPDLELFPPHFEASNVIFKAGVELTLFNYAFSILASLRKVIPDLNLPALAESLSRLSSLFRAFGTLNGCVAVWVTGQDARQKSLAIVARENGPRVASAPAVLLARKLLSHEISAFGAFACIGFLEIQEIAEFLAPFNISLVHGENGKWQS